MNEAVFGGIDGCRAGLVFVRIEPFEKAVFANSTEYDRFGIPIQALCFNPGGSKRTLW